MLKRYWWLLLLVLLSVPQLSFASEATYHITESELTQLENNLMELSDLNDKQSEMLSQQQIQLRESEEKLSLAEQESEKLQNQIYSLRKEMIEQESSLETARVSLEQFEKEEQAKLNRAKQEKTAAWIIAGLLLCLCVGK